MFVYIDEVNWIVLQFIENILYIDINGMVFIDVLHILNDLLFSAIYWINWWNILELTWNWYKWINDLAIVKKKTKKKILGHTNAHKSNKKKQ